MVMQEMHSKKMYKKMVFYLEACESGSMFQVHETSEGRRVRQHISGKGSLTQLDETLVSNGWHKDSRRMAKG